MLFFFFIFMFKFFFPSRKIFRCVWETVNHLFFSKAPYSSQVNISIITATESFFFIIVVLFLGWGGGFQGYFKTKWQLMTHSFVQCFSEKTTNESKDYEQALRFILMKKSNTLVTEGLSWLTKEEKILNYMWIRVTVEKWKLWA